MDRQMDERIGKLPVWAQKLIEGHARENERLRNEIASYFGEVESPISIRYLGSISTRRAVNRHAIFEWVNNKGRAINVSVRDSELRVSSHGTLVVKPHASNVIRVTIED